MTLLIVSDVGERPFVSLSKAIACKKGPTGSISLSQEIQAADRSAAICSPKWAKNRWSWLGLALFFCLVMTSPARAASFDFNDTSWEGSSELLHLARSRFGSDRVRLVASIDFATLTPGDGLLILHPSVALPADAFNVFMLSGGRIAILDDFGSSGPFLERFGIRRTNPPLRPVEALRGNHNLAWAEPIRNGAEGQGEFIHSMVVGIAHILTNHPTTFVNPGLTPVLEIRARDGASYPLAISGVIGQRGRLFAMGDPSAVINLMLRYPENRQFAERLLDYLVEDDTWGARKGKLYLVANEFSQQHASSDPLSPRFLSQSTAGSRQQLGSMENSRIHRLDIGPRGSIDDWSRGLATNGAKGWRLSAQVCATRSTRFATRGAWAGCGVGRAIHPSRARTIGTNGGDLSLPNGTPRSR